ncbi:MAG: enoyl-CoA hydratase/isomerase family protein [Actinomycetales bacterium]|nr:enoyl-CoA hydratase/isomerase family protein [Actinomycetales bacterium]
MDFVAYDLSNQVATITITREEALNALDAAVLAELDAALDRVVADRARALVVTGAGRAFVAGADVARMATFSVAEARAFSEQGNRVFRKLELLGAPSIAAVNGYALGGGCELALACDLRVASERAVFAQPEVGLGVTAGFGGTQRLARLVGPAVAKEMLLSGRRVKADRALEIGLVNSVHPPEELLDAARALADEIAQQAPLAVRATKAALARGAHVDLDAALAIEVEEFAACFETADQREAMGAFVEKRQHAPFQDE